MIGDVAKQPRSLHQRVVIAFALSAFVLSSVFALSVWGVLHLVEDRMVERALELELEDFLERLRADPQAVPPMTRWLHGTFDPEALPPELQSEMGREDGVYELNPGFALVGGEEGREPEYTLLIRTLEDGRRLYFYLDAVRIEAIDESLGLIGLSLLATVLVVTSIGFVLGRATAQRVIAPVTELADRVRQRASDEMESDASISLTEGFAADEVGLLAEALEASEQRTRAFLERERRFTGDASHELRSPVTIVRGAVELLESRPEAEAPGISRPLARIRRATDDMQRLIESFLWLAREKVSSSDPSHVESVTLKDEIKSALDRYHHLIEGKDLEVIQEVDPNATVQAPEGVLGIVIGNLVANAFFFTQSGRIRVTADATSLIVDDDGPGIPAARRESVMEPHQRGADSGGFGLGLAICRDLCTRFGWRLELADGEHGRGTRAQVWFQDNA